MAISPKMLAIIEKVDAADAAYSAGLRATAKEEAEAREKAMLAEIGPEPPARQRPSRVPRRGLEILDGGRA